MIIEKLACQSIETVVFCGGDPTLSPNLLSFSNECRRKKMRVEIQTNAEHLTVEAKQALFSADLVGLSLDSGVAENHDEIRGSTGNFNRVLELARALEQRDINIEIRSVACKDNFESLARLSEHLASLSNLLSWHIIEFSNVEDVVQNPKSFALSRSEYHKLLNEVQNRAPGITVKKYLNEEKSGTYFQIMSDGTVFTPNYDKGTYRYQKSGNLLIDSVENCLKSLPMDINNHAERYER